MNEPEDSKKSPPNDLPQGSPIANLEESLNSQKDWEQSLSTQSNADNAILDSNAGERDDFKPKNSNHGVDVQTEPEGVLVTEIGPLAMPLNAPIEDVSPPENPSDNSHEDFVQPNAGPNFTSPRFSGPRKTPSGSIQVLVIFLLASFSVCSAMLNLYLFWQARNLGAELERVKPPGKSGLAPRR